MKVDFDNIERLTPKQIEAYRALVIDAMCKFGASDDEVELIRDATIRNSIRNHRDPEDAAWAILQ